MPVDDNEEISVRWRNRAIAVLALVLWTGAVGFTCWIGGQAKERIYWLEATNAALTKLREQDQATYGIIDRAKAETVATCVNLKGKDCEKVLE